MQWWLQIGGQTSTGKASGSGLKVTRHLRGNAMSAKTTPKKATQNLINMVVVLAVSGTILLGLLAAKHF
jgi:hypothetical protein